MSRRTAGLAVRRAPVVITVLIVGALSLGAQAPLPPAGRGQGPASLGQDQTPATLPNRPAMVALPAAFPATGSPGQMFPSLMSLPAASDMSHLGYTTQEFFVSGNANGEAYRTRMVVRRPIDDTRFSGIVMAESMHPSGNAWMFHFTHLYAMSSGHIAVEILTSDPAPLAAFNSARYGDLKVAPRQVDAILAQAGALIRSAQTLSPLAGLPVRKVILAGTSASAAVLINYLPAHVVYRLQGMKPIYDGFLPTSTGAAVRPVDVPIIQVPTTTEAMRGTVPIRQDGDAGGDQFRVYEFPGMPHLATRDIEVFTPNPCRYPVSEFPMTAYMSVALHHLVRWIDAGIVPPRAERILLDRNVANDGSLMALDSQGNPRGGVRTPYVDVPTARHGVPNEGAVPPRPNTVPWVALRGEAGINQLCNLTGYQFQFVTAELRRLYGNKGRYLDRVRRRVDELERDGWSLPMFRAQILADAQHVAF